MPSKGQRGPALSYPTFVNLVSGEETAEEVFYRKLVEVLHPSGLACPGCGVHEGLRVHRRRREPVIDYLCTHCFRVFNAWSGTVLQGIHRPPSHILYILHAGESGMSTSLLARELRCQRPSLVTLRRRLQPLEGRVVMKIPQLAEMRRDPDGEKDRRTRDVKSLDSLLRIDELNY
jgi:hypothetical protein